MVSQREQQAAVESAPVAGRRSAGKCLSCEEQLAVRGRVALGAWKPTEDGHKGR